MRTWINSNPSTLVVAKGELVSLLLRGRACRVACVTGTLWVTMGGHQEDCMLAPGQEVTLAGRGRIVVEALRTATVRFELRNTARVKARALSPLKLSGSDFSGGILPA